MADMIIVEPFGPLNVSTTITPMNNQPSVHCYSTLVGLANLSTNDPREVYNSTATSGSVLFTVDFGSNVTWDTLAFVNSNAPAGATVTIYHSTDPANYYANAPINAVIFRTASDDVPGVNGPACFVLPVPVTARTIAFAIVLPAGSPPFSIGRLVIGRSWKPTYPRELGAGRPMIDSGSRERLVDGGLATVSGALVSGFDWTFGDLDDADLAKLWGIFRRCRTTEPIVLIEDPGAPTAEGFHYGTLAKLERFERSIQSKSRWSLKVEDW